MDIIARTEKVIELALKLASNLPSSEILMTSALFSREIEIHNKLADLYKKSLVELERIRLKKQEQEAGENEHRT